MTGESLRSLGEGVHAIVLAGGCFWGVDDRLRHLPGVLGTAAGYAGGHTPDPTYEQVCRGHTGYAESVLVVFDPRVLPLERVLAAFWEMHDPTQGMRQGNATRRPERHTGLIVHTAALQLRARTPARLRS